MRKFSPPVKAVVFAAFVSFVALFSSCDLDDDDGTIPRFGPTVSGVELNGIWASTLGDSIKIDKDNNTCSYWFGAAPEYSDPYSMDYAGTIVGEILADKTLLQSKFGYLTIKVTDAGGYGPDVGKFFVIYWKDLSSGSVQEAGAYNATGNNSGMTTIAEAVAEYTVANGYFGILGIYEKQ
jgi:hypothetical protein